MGAGPETIAVVVVTYNSAHFVPDLIASLEDGMRGVRWHLTVADNASADDTVAVVREQAPTALIVQTGRNAGYAAGINAAVAAADPHDAVLVLNPDIRLAPECAAELLVALRRSGAGIAVPRLFRGDGSFSPSLRREPTVLRALGDAVLGGNRAGRFPRIGEVITDERLYDVEATVDWAEGSILLIDHTCWLACGPWDESYFLYSEETEYALRARDRGFAMIYAPSASARHLEGDSASSPPLWTLLTLNRVRLFRRRHGSIATAAYWTAIVLRETSRATRGNRCSRSAVRALLGRARPGEIPGPEPAGGAAARRSVAKQ